MTVGILREVGALVQKVQGEMLEFIKFILLFISCHAIRLKVNRLNRPKAKSHRERLDQSGKVFQSLPELITFTE